MLKPEIIDLLGGRKVLASRAARIGEERASYGRRRQSPARLEITPFRTTSVANLARRLDVARDELMIVLGITGRTAQRRRQTGLLSDDESDRLYRVARIVQRAFDVFGSETKASRWFKKSKPFFEGRTPLALLGTDPGAQAVEQELGRIEYGNFS